jgi:hypothetical protein
MYRQSLNQSDNQQLIGYFNRKARDFIKLSFCLTCWEVTTRNMYACRCPIYEEDASIPNHFVFQASRLFQIDWYMR